jgi:hypothetical protein
LSPTETLLIDFLHFRRFLGGVNQQLRTLLPQVGQFCFRLVCLFGVGVGKRAGAPGRLGCVVLRLCQDAFVLSLE